MTNSMPPPTTVSNLGVAMFTVSDQDAAITYYTRTLGWELRADVAFGEGPVPRMFSIVDPDGNHIWVTQAAAPS